MHKTKRRVLKVLCVMATMMLGYSVYRIADAIRVYREGNTVYEEILETVAEEKKEEGEIDFAALRRVNPQVVGWIRLEGTIIDYPVVQGADNLYYLDHLFDRRENWMGSVFVDSRVPSNFQNRLTPIYAHHTNNGAMFYLLESYKQQEFYDEHPVWKYYTPKESYALIPFAGMVVDSHSSFLKLKFEDEEAFQSYIRSFCEASTFVPKEDYDGEEQIVMLCTCTDDFADARYVLLCKIRRE